MTNTPAPLPPNLLRWRCDAATLGFQTTAEVEPIEGVVGQATAVEALAFGLGIDAPGQNVFVRGLAGTGRLTLIRNHLRTLETRRPQAPDRVYVHNFDAPDRPRLLELPRGEGRPFVDALDRLVRFIENDLPERLGPVAQQGQGRVLAEQAEAELNALSAPLEARLAEVGLALAFVESENGAPRAVIVPQVDGEPVAPGDLKAVVESGKLTVDNVKELEQHASTFAPEAEAFAVHAMELGARHRERLSAAVQALARDALAPVVATIKERFSTAAQQLDAVVEDCVTRRLDDLDEPVFTRLYRGNLIAGHGANGTRPVIVDNNPTVQSLIGSIDPVVLPDGTMDAPHMGLHAGAIVRADGGTLILDARDLATSDGAWLALTRTLRSGSVELRPGDNEATTVRQPGLKPAPIPVDVKVVLLGQADVYHALDSADPEFPHLFKVLVDFEDVLPRDPEGQRLVAGVLSRIVRDEGLPHLSSDAVAALIEHGARIAARPDVLTARFGRVADIAREAVWVGRQRGCEVVTGDDVREAVRRTKERAGLPGRVFRDNVRRGVLRIETRGERVGQINGLAVTQAGQLTYGFPARITATVGPGRQGTVNIEGEASLSGRIHTKAFHILGGCLRTLLPTPHPLAFDASIAFEQSYGGIDGDSASGAETCCLISAMSGVPIRQGIAMTGAIDQRGQILPVGAVNEKIEGFYDTCVSEGLTGDQGAILPAACVGDLMLRPDVVDACAEGRFHVWPVQDVHQAITLLTGVEAGVRGDGGYAPGTVLYRAMAAAHRFWEQGDGARPRG